MKNILIEYVQLLAESVVSLYDGREVEYGSDEHLNDLEEMVAKLEFHRNRHTKGSIDRDAFARARNKLANRVRRIRRKRGDL